MKMKAKPTIHEFDPQIYPRMLWVTVGVPYKELKEEFEDLDPMADNSEAEVIYTTRTGTEDGGVLIRFENAAAMSLRNICHEATHAAVGIFDYIGAPVDINHQEPFAYLTGWVASCLEKVRKEYE